MSANTILFLFVSLTYLHIVLCPNKMAALKPIQSQNVLKVGEKKINDGVEASTRKSQARFQIIRVSYSAEPRMRLE